MAIVGIATEYPDTGEWVVGLDTPNPAPHQALLARDGAHAFEIKAQLESLACPRCGSRDIIPPALKYRVFSCDPCGHDFMPPGFVLDKAEGR
jgi:hypothetical protein